VAKPKPKKEPATPLQKAQPFGRWFWGKVFSLVGSNGRLVVVTVGICTCVWTVADAFKAFAGRQSIADLKFGFLADIRVVWTVSVAVGITGLALYFREVSLHRQTRERLAARNTELELRIDPTRRSSKLTAQGLTREDDK
jgi:hypothetical protein